MWVFTYMDEHGPKKKRNETKINKVNEIRKLVKIYNNEKTNI